METIWSWRTDWITLIAALANLAASCCDVMYFTVPSEINFKWNKCWKKAYGSWRQVYSLVKSKVIKWVEPANCRRVGRDMLALYFFITWKASCRTFEYGLKRLGGTWMYRVNAQITYFVMTGENIILQKNLSEKTNRQLDFFVFFGKVVLKIWNNYKLILENFWEF